MSAVSELARDVVRICLDRMIPRASAALAYHLTMSLFPLIICLYALFGRSDAVAARALGQLEPLLTPAAAELLRSFLRDVAAGGGHAVPVAVMVLITSASAAARTLLGTVGEMRGGRRRRALRSFLTSLALALALLPALYFAIAALLTGQEFLRWARRVFPARIVDFSWAWARFFLLGGVALLLLWALFRFSGPREDRRPALPGAAFATAGIVVMSQVFSRLIASSARYSLVYGSLASVILLMLWLYLVCQAMFAGAALNVALSARAFREPFGRRAV